MHIQQSDHGLHCPPTESMDTTKCMNGDHKSGRYFAHMQDALRILRMFEGTFLHIKTSEFLSATCLL